LVVIVGGFTFFASESNKLRSFSGVSLCQADRLHERTGHNYFVKIALAFKPVGFCQFRMGYSVSQGLFQETLNAIKLSVIPDPDRQSRSGILSDEKSLGIYEIPAFAQTGSQE